jgi:glycosyltransferase involved in cell wall biosynthesis
MALGTPVVSTSKGAQGLDATHGENILIADTPSEFASHIEAIIRTPSLRERLAREGRAFVRSRYDWRVVGTEFLSVVEHAAGGHRVLTSGSPA